MSDFLVIQKKLLVELHDRLEDYIAVQKHRNATTGANHPTEYLVELSARVRRLLEGSS